MIYGSILVHIDIQPQQELHMIHLTTILTVAVVKYHSIMHMVSEHSSISFLL